MIFVLSLLLLAIVGTPIFALLAFFALAEFLSAPGLSSWAPPTIDPLGTRWLDSPLLAALPVLVLYVRLQRPKARAVFGDGLFWLSLFLYGVVAELPIRALLLAGALPAAVVAVGTALWRREVALELRTLRDAKGSLLVLGLALAAFLRGLLDPQELSAVLVLCTIAGNPRVLRSPTLLDELTQDAVRVGAVLIVVTTLLGIGAWIEYLELARWSVLSIGLLGLTGYQLAVVVALGIEAGRIATPAVEHAAAAQLGERYGAPMTAAARKHLLLVLATLLLSVLVRGFTAWLPALLGLAPTTS